MRISKEAWGRQGGWASETAYEIYVKKTYFVTFGWSRATCAKQKISAGFYALPPVVPHALRESVLKIFGLEHFQTVMIMIVLGNGWGVGW